MSEENPITDLLTTPLRDQICDALTEETTKIVQNDNLFGKTFLETFTDELTTFLSEQFELRNDLIPAGLQQSREEVLVVLAGQCVIRGQLPFIRNVRLTAGRGRADGDENARHILGQAVNLAADALAGIGAM